MSNIVVVTGASGFVGQHLIKYFHDNHGTLNIKEIRSVDLKPFKPDIDINLKIYMKHHQMDVCDEAKLEKVFEGASCIYHLAQKGMDHYYSNYSADITTSYWSKNINSIESVVNCMVSKDIQNIVFLGNAYCNLARCDNFGLSEDNYKGLSNSGYILGTYGETKSRAELFLRTFAENNTTVSGKKLQVICVRPTIVYGEGNCKTLNALLDICNQNDGVFPYCSGSRGLHQYIYVGNLVYILTLSMKKIFAANGNHKNIFFYAMDDTIAHHVYDFFLPVLQLSNHKVDDSATHIVRLNYSLYSEYFQRIFGFTKADHYVSDISKQFFINFALGFSNRKCCLYLNPAMPFNQKEALNQTMAWMSDKKVNNSLSKENIKISSRSNAGTG